MPKVARRWLGGQPKLVAYSKEFKKLLAYREGSARLYANMSAKEANEYASVKSALLRRYDLNEEGYRRRFWESKPEATEIASLFMFRLSI